MACSAIALCDVVSLRFHVLLEIPLCFFSLYEYELIVGIKIVPEEMQCNRYDPRGGPNLEPWATDTFFFLAEGVTPCADHRELASIVLLSCSYLRRDDSRMNVVRKLVHVQIYPRETLYIDQYWAYSVMC